MEFTHFSSGPSWHGDSIKVMSLYCRCNIETAGNIPRQHPSLSSCYYLFAWKRQGSTQREQSNWRWNIRKLCSAWFIQRQFAFLLPYPHKRQNISSGVPWICLLAILCWLTSYTGSAGSFLRSCTCSGVQAPCGKYSEKIPSSFRSFLYSFLFLRYLVELAFNRSSNSVSSYSKHTSFYK